MEEAQELQLHIKEVPGSPGNAMGMVALPRKLASSTPKDWRWWLMLALFTSFILIGQTVANLFGRFYYDKGGKSLWMATIVQSAGSPLLFPFLLFVRPSSFVFVDRPTSSSKIAAVYAGIGLLVAGDNLMYSYGLLYLPVSTYALLCATQLVFNAAFAYFLNSQKLTPYITNSVLLLTLAAALLGVHSEGGAASGKYAVGFVLTLGASALFSLILSLTQLAFQKVLKSETFVIVVEMILWTNFIAAAASVVGLFAGGEWKGIHGEFLEFESGRVSYVMTLLWIALGWLVYSIGTVGLIYVFSSLFANVIGTLALPLVPIFAVVFFHDKMDGVKVVALLIALLGFVNYVYQHYLDDPKSNK